jgi:hypothetical protein
MSAIQSLRGPPIRIAHTKEEAVSIKQLERKRRSLRNHLMRREGQLAGVLRSSNVKRNDADISSRPSKRVAFGDGIASDSQRGTLQSLSKSSSSSVSTALGASNGPVFDDAYVDADVYDSAFALTTGDSDTNCEYCDDDDDDDDDDVDEDSYYYD